MLKIVENYELLCHAHNHKHSWYPKYCLANQRKLNVYLKKQTIFKNTFVMKCNSTVVLNMNNSWIKPVCQKN